MMVEILVVLMMLTIMMAMAMTIYYGSNNDENGRNDYDEVHGLNYF